MTPLLLEIVVIFAGLSLLAIGGGDSIIPDMQRIAVQVHHWMSDREFLDLFALSRATPGPGSLVVVLVGQKAAGFGGACAAAAGMYIPSCSLMYLATRLWENGRAVHWKRIAEKTLAPLGIGLILSSGTVLMQSTQHSFLAFLLTAVATLVLATRSISPLWMLILGGAVGGIVGL
jgi:chromate transporter